MKKSEALAAPGGVESLEAIAREAQGMQAGEQAQAQQAQQAQQQAQEHAQAGQEKAQQQTVAQAMGEVAEMLRDGRDMLVDFVDEAGMLPKEKALAIWTDDRVNKLAGPLMVLADRHGGEIGPFLQKHGPWLALIGAAAMPAFATMKAVRAHKALDVAARVVPAGEGGVGG